MAPETTPVDLFESSMERCLASKEFLSDFYRRFLGSSDEVKAKFANTDFILQRFHLSRTLRMLGGAARGESLSLKNLNDRAESHSRRGLDIRPELYRPWKESLLETVRQCDAEWSPEIESAWVQMLDEAADYMIKAY